MSDRYASGVPLGKRALSPAIAAYARSRASATAGPCAVTVSTRPPGDDTVLPGAGSGRSSRAEAPQNATTSSGKPRSAGRPASLVFSYGYLDVASTTPTAASSDQVAASTSSVPSAADLR